MTQDQPKQSPEPIDDAALDAVNGGAEATRTDSYQKPSRPQPYNPSWGIGIASGSKDDDPPTP